jgi:hypothetical protein
VNLMKEKILPNATISARGCMLGLLKASELLGLTFLLRFPLNRRTRIEKIRCVGISPEESTVEIDTDFWYIHVDSNHHRDDQIALGVRDWS